MPTSLSNLVNNLSDGLHNDKCDRKSCLDYMLVKDTQLIFKHLNCNKNHDKAYMNSVIKISINLFYC